MVFDIWCTEPYKTTRICILWWAMPWKMVNKCWTVWLVGPSCWHHGCCQLDLGIGWPVNPLTQVDSTESLWTHMQNTAILCHSVPLLGMICHLGGWGLVADTWSSSHRTCSELAKHQVILTILVLVLLDSQILRIMILKTKIYFMWGCHILGGLCQLEFWKGGCHMLGGLCQLEFWKNCSRKAWEIWTTTLPN